MFVVNVARHVIGSTSLAGLTTNICRYPRSRLTLIHIFALPVLLSLLIFPGCSDSGTPAGKITIFEAAGFAPVIDAITAEAEGKLNVSIIAEASGTQVACRKLSELGRRCDILISADEKLFRELVPDKTEFRLDFATDEIVLAFGQRAKFADDVEKDWAKALFEKDVRLGRGDENLCPVGYRTLMTWQLQEKFANIAGFSDNLKSKSAKVVDDVMHLTPLLKTGEIDYAFLYRSMCIAQDIRHIRLDRKVNLGDISTDYSSVSVKLGKGKVIKGGPVIFSLSIPSNSENPESASRLIKYLLTDKAGVIKAKGFTPIKPTFHGKKELFKPFADFAEFSDEKI